MVVSQGFLAGAVAAALGSFCELDESLVESRLLNKSRITLKDLRLKPRVIRQTSDYTVELHGKIKTGVFKWKWTGKGLNKCTFTLTGLQITLKPVSGDSEHAKELESEAKDKAKEKSKSKNRMSMSDRDAAAAVDGEEEGKQGRKNWKDKLVRNIIDQLTIKIEDIQVIMEAPKNAIDESNPNTPWKRQVILTGKNIELEPLARKISKKSKFLTSKKNKASAPLLQDLRIGSLSVNVLMVDKDGNATLLPLLQPIQYYARLKRVHGNRFGALSTGLEVIGHSKDVSLLSSSHSSSTSNSNSNSASTASLIGSSGVYESMVTNIKGQRVEVYADDEEIEASLCNFRPSYTMSQSVNWQFSSASAIPTTTGTGTNNYVESRDDDEMEVEQYIENDATDKLHLILGDEQLTSLFSVISMFIDEENSTTTSPILESLSEEERNRINSRHILMRPGGLGQISKVAPMSFAKSTRDIVKASKFDLPFPFVHIELPNNSSLHASNCQSSFRTDDSLAKIYGTGDVNIDGKTLLKGGICWTIDIMKKVITIDPNHKEDNDGTGVGNRGKKELSHHWEFLNHEHNGFNSSDSNSSDVSDSPLHFRIEEVKKLSEGLVQIVQKKLAARRGPVPPPPDERWSMKLRGNSCLQF